MGDVAYQNKDIVSKILRCLWCAHVKNHRSASCKFAGDRGE